MCGGERWFIHSPFFRVESIGKRCKFSHDPTIERKATKKDIYSDDREPNEEKEKDTMENWDEEKLRQVVKSKHENPQTTTDIVCKYFIEAVENSKYGWFWTCMSPRKIPFAY